MNPRTCPHCGKKNFTESPICSHCNRELDAVPAGGYRSTSPSPIPTPKRPAAAPPPAPIPRPAPTTTSAVPGPTPPAPYSVPHPASSPVPYSSPSTPTPYSAVTAGVPYSPLPAHMLKWPPSVVEGEVEDVSEIQVEDKRVKGGDVAKFIFGILLLPSRIPRHRG